MTDDINELPFGSPLVPELLDQDTKISFKCYPGISCFNACCKQSSIQLTPYDIIRLKTNLGMTSTEFLKEYTVPDTMDGHGMPSVKLKTMDESPACKLMVEGEGCSVYEDRPTACRYYPVGLMNMKKKDEKEDEQHHFVVREGHCKGHDEKNEITIAEYRKQQGVVEYDDINRDWYRIILKKRSGGPSIGSLSDMSLQMFFMASYDVDRFRRFVLSEGFANNYNVDADTIKSFENDDVALVQFGFKLMLQVFYGDKSIDEKDGAYNKRMEERKEILEFRKEAELKEWKGKNDAYEIEQEKVEEEKK